MNPDGKYVVNVDKDVDASKLAANVRVALRHDSYDLYKILPNKVRPVGAPRSPWP